MGYYMLAAVIGYFVGNFSPSYLLGRFSKDIDIRNYGSGNAGTTNAMRVLGTKSGLIVFLCDVIKGAVATWLGMRLTSGNPLGGAVSGCMAVIGHNWPCLLRFRGGKGIACSFGLILVLFPKIGLLLFLIVVALVLATRYVSLGSISAAILFPVLLAIFREPPEMILVGVLLALLALFRHKENIKRLLNGQENKFSFSKSGKNI